jgi:hypothetical protein
VGRQAEEAGFSTRGTVGRYAYPGVSDAVALAAAGATSRIGLLSQVLLAPTWPPYLLIADMVAANLSGGVEAIKNVVKAFEDIGAEELVLGPGVADLDEISRLADTVL